MAGIARLTALLRSGRPEGKVLRVLVRRLRRPEKPYTNQDLEALLTLTLALKAAGLWP